MTTIFEDRCSDSPFVERVWRARSIHGRAFTSIAACHWELIFTQLNGSSNLVRTLLQHDLIDTLRIWQFPVVLGTGKRLFGEGTIPRSFRLGEAHMNTTGAVLHVYERVGGLTYGEGELGQETVLRFGHSA